MNKWISLCLISAFASAAMAQDGKQIVQKMEQRYMKMKSIEMKATANIKVTGMTNMDQKVSFEMAYTKPNKAVIKSSMQGMSRELYSDGKTMYSYMPSQKTYQKAAAPPNLAALGGSPNDPAALIFSLMSGNLTKDPDTKFKFVRSAKVGARDVHVVEISPKRNNANVNASVLMFIGKADNLVHRVEMTQSVKMQGQGNQPPTEMKMNGFADLQYVSVDKAIAPARFAFKPPKDAKEATGQGGGPGPAPRR